MRFRVAAVLLQVVCGAALLAQQPIAMITGILRDPNGNAIGNIGSSVSARNTVNQAEFSARIQPDGTFRLTVPPGIYDLSVPKSGARYAAYERKSVTLPAGETSMDINVTWGLNLGTIGDDQAALMRDIAAMAKVPDGPTPRMPDGKPDLNGIWARTSIEDEQPPQQPWAENLLKKLQAVPGALDANLYCLPASAMPFALPNLQKVVHTPTVIVHLSEANPQAYRQIFLDGRPRPKAWNPSFMGHSLGTWDGDTLVVDSIGFNEKATGVGIHTEKLRIVERIRRPDLGHLDVESTVADPDAYTRP